MKPIIIGTETYSAKIYKKLDEFIVRFYSRSHLIKSADYFTDCKADAVLTANAVIADLVMTNN